jgi:uncharacterized membrane protein (GlpM family)
MTSFAKTRLIVAIALNLAGVIAYLGFASRSWIEPGHSGNPGALSEGVALWTMTAYPILLAFITINFLWFGFEYFVFMAQKTWRLNLVALAITIAEVVAAWAIAMYIDYAHHGI